MVRPGQKRFQSGSPVRTPQEVRMSRTSRRKRSQKKSDGVTVVHLVRGEEFYCKDLQRDKKKITILCTIVFIEDEDVLVGKLRI